ncbi:hypothetical protein [Nonomuraea dietziae]|uniref:hypothetical protein n=1 Tax=Nonomuraea dietziae TaxID=65515 RepID=UPI00342CA370
MPNIVVNRRRALLAGLATAGAGVMGVNVMGGTAAADPYVTREPLLAGANPFVTLYEEGRPTAYASVWRVDWSRYGSGAALVVWTPGGLRVIGDEPRLARWIEEHFVRHFDEAKALPSWPAVRVERAAVHVRIDPVRGAFAGAGDLTVRIGDPLDARPVGIADFPIQGVSHGLSMQLVPCRSASITVGGVAVPGAPAVTWNEGRPSSSAVTTVHEAWSM